MSIGLRIAEIRNNNRKTAFASDLGITADYLRMLESGEKNPGKTLIKLICHKFNLSEEWLTTGDGGKHTFRAMELNSGTGSGENLFSINIYNFDDLSEQSDLKDITNHLKDKIPTTAILLPEGFGSDKMIALRVSNNAMSPQITKHSIIGVDINEREFEDGALYLVKASNKDILIRRVYKKPDSVTLLPNNKNFPEINLDRKCLDNKLIIGSVRWVIQKT